MESLKNKGNSGIIKINNLNKMTMKRGRFLSKRLQNYIYTIKIKERNEVYETMLIMFLNDELVGSLEDLIDKNLSEMKSISDRKIIFKTHPSEEYTKAIKQVCKSKYFRENFNKYEIRRKKEIMNEIINELIINIILNTKFGESNGLIEDSPTMYPFIKHKILKTDKKITLTFDQETPLNEISLYLKEVLKIKNKPKKKKLSLGKSFRILILDNLVRENKNEYSEPYVYIEELTRKEYNKKYKEDLSIEDIQKSLQRIRKIKKEINTI